MSTPELFTGDVVSIPHKGPDAGPPDMGYIIKVVRGQVIWSMGGGDPVLAPLSAFVPLETPHNFEITLPPYEREGVPWHPQAAWEYRP